MAHEDLSLAAYELFRAAYRYERAPRLTENQDDLEEAFKHLDAIIPKRVGHLSRAERLRLTPREPTVVPFEDVAVPA